MTAADSISYKWMSADDFWPVFKEHSKTIFAHDTTIDVVALYDDATRAHQIKLRENLNQIAQFYLLAYHDDRVIGWSFGRQETQNIYYMVNSAVFPEYRRQGIYAHMLDMMVEKCVHAGFTHIYSRHQVSNNPVIIAKLRKGFMISGMEVSPAFGTLVRLSYFVQKEEAAIFRFRSGEEKINHTLAEYVVKADQGSES